MEKQTKTIAMRCTERMEIDVMRLAAAADRSVSDYLRAIVADHLYGHARIFARQDQLAQQDACLRGEHGTCSREQRGATD